MYCSSFSCCKSISLGSTDGKRCPDPMSSDGLPVCSLLALRRVHKQSPCPTFLKFPVSFAHFSILAPTPPYQPYENLRDPHRARGVGGLAYCLQYNYCFLGSPTQSTPPLSSGTPLRWEKEGRREQSPSRQAYSPTSYFIKGHLLTLQICLDK